MSTVAFISGLLGLKPARAVSPPLLTGVQLQSVSSFYGPLMPERLSVGKSLDVVWKWGRALVALDGFLLGRLPTQATQVIETAMRGGQSIKIRIERIERTSQGRLLLYVSLASEKYD